MGHIGYTPRIKKNLKLKVIKREKLAYKEQNRRRCGTLRNSS